MKNKILSLLISIFALGVVSAAEVGTASRAEIARMLSRVVSREITGGYQKAEPTTVRIEAVKASRSRVQIYATVGLSYYPFREDNVRALRDFIRYAKDNGAWICTDEQAARWVLAQNGFTEFA